MNIKDKIIISEERVCPPHCLFHKLPFTKPITDELCHYHQKKWRTTHHILFCKYLRCKNYEFMINKYEKDNKTIFKH